MLDLGEEVLRMPWREVTRVSLRKEFVLLAMQAGSNRRELCRRFGIAPKTGYKWLLGATPFQWTVLGLRLSFLFAESFRS